MTAFVLVACIVAWVALAFLMCYGACASAARYEDRTGTRDL